MKKLFLFVAAGVFVAAAAQAQDVKKQQGGEQNLELLFAPLGGSPISTEGGIKYRQFTSATSAWRATVHLGFSSDTDVMVQGEDELKSVNSAFDISIAPGMEWHMAGTDNLSPYFGAELRVAFGTSSVKDEYVSVDDDIEDQTTKDGYFGVGAGVFAGFDWYFTNRVYLGTELGFGVMFNSEMDTKTTFSDGDIKEPEPVPNGSSFGVGPHAVGKIRLGFLF